MSHFDVYGRMALVDDVSETSQNGRYLAQKKAEKNIPADITSKLKPTSHDHFLDIGCGLGLNLSPFADIVEKATGCDHPNVIAKLKKIYPDTQVELLGGNFLDLDFSTKYTKILAYSVLPALPNKDVLYAFVDKALDLLHPMGRALLGDLSNIDKKNRFMSSERGKAFQKQWENLRSESKNEQDVSQFQEKEDLFSVTIDDKFTMDLVRHIRKRGFHAYVVNQPQNLPFGNTREDILIVGPEYKDEE